MRLIKGEHLTAKQVNEVKRRFVHRHTGEHYYQYTPKLYETDQEWIKNHAFYIRNDGKLSNQHNHCEPHYMAD